MGLSTAGSDFTAHNTNKTQTVLLHPGWNPVASINCNRAGLLNQWALSESVPLTALK